MTTTTTETPLGRKAREVLRVIEANRDALDMSTWWEGPGAVFTPNETPCGTTMCVAGWRAHLSGWTLVDDGRATKDGRELKIEVVAVDEFEPADEGEIRALRELFYTGPSRALAVLRYVADQGTFPPGGIQDDDALDPYWRD
ncbi:hypothetical protein [Streptomyces sp. NPDC093261]|uniref:hypothetical protein n=1 Tax=Streptomyces sp. NPDC093261 TaxID=3366037 RepID=UPI0037F90279